MKLRRLSTFVMSALLVAGAACGSDSGGGSESLPPLERIRASSQEVIDAGTSRMTMSIETSGPTAVTFTGEGAYDYDEKVGSFTLDTSALAAAGFPAELKIVTEGRTLYMNLGSLLGGGKTWARLDLDRADELGPQFESLAELGTNNDPRAALAYLAGVNDDVKTVGREKVRGDDTTHYSATIDLQKAADAVEDPDQEKALRNVIDKLGTSTIPGEFWIDGEGRLRRYRSVIDLSTVDAGDQQLSGSTTSVMEFFDFGAEIDVATPDEAETADLAELLKGLGGAAG